MPARSNYVISQPTEWTDEITLADYPEILLHGPQAWNKGSAGIRLVHKMGYQLLNAQKVETPPLETFSDG
jgi:hypothetical protein